MVVTATAITSAVLRSAARPPVGTGRAVVFRRPLALPVTQIPSRAAASSAEPIPGPFRERHGR